MERAPPAYMGRPRRKPPSPGRQWFVARRFPTLAASSFQPPLHGFPSSSGCVCHVAQADGDPLPRPTLLLCRLHQGLALLDNKDNHHLDRIAARRALVVDRAMRQLERLADLVNLLRLAIDEIPEFAFCHVGEQRAWMRMSSRLEAASQFGDAEHNFIV